MNSAKQVIVHSLTTSKMLIRKYTEDLKPAELLHRVTPKGNCVAWLLGHLTLADRRVMTFMGVTNIPELPAGFDKAFAREESAQQCPEFQDANTLLPTFEKMRDALMAAVLAATPEQLDKPVENPFPMFKTVGEMANFMAVHTAMHGGQITIIRRSLGYPPLI